jgi:hypothetical protein
MNDEPTEDNDMPDGMISAKVFAAFTISLPMQRS